MTVTNDLLTLAKQGDTQAIAALLNRQLQSKGITARATLKGCCLHVLLESDTTPDRATLLPWIQKGSPPLPLLALKPPRSTVEKLETKMPLGRRSFHYNNHPLYTNQLAVLYHRHHLSLKN
ncbi:MAG: hypothetical protein HC925_00690 [Coleofasciculaceae cyanobacterium SM2_3_26]|nr:hypothetical protein [Coleofasciculaceae cyanobacterium SM2_3_26]